MAIPSPQPSKPGVRPLLVFFAALGCVVAAAIAVGVLPRLTHQKTMLAASEKSAQQRPVVIASPAHFTLSKDGIDLPGDLQALIESPIFARADGLHEDSPRRSRRQGQNRPTHGRNRNPRTRSADHPGARFARPIAGRAQGTPGRYRTLPRQPEPVEGYPRPLGPPRHQRRRLQAGARRKARRLRCEEGAN